MSVSSFPTSNLFQSYDSVQSHRRLIPGQPQQTPHGGVPTVYIHPSTGGMI
jgi:hypothetical protein